MPNTIWGVFVFSYPVVIESGFLVQDYSMAMGASMGLA